MKKLLVLAALIVLAVPAAYAASASNPKPSTSAAPSQSSDENAAKACKSERASLGVAAFNKKYGTNYNSRNAFGKCVSGKSKGKHDVEKQGKDENKQQGNHEKQGKGENEQGENEQGENEQGENEQGEKGSSNAAQQCKKELAATGAQSFAKKYGTYDKCVSSKAKEHHESDDD